MASYDNLYSRVVALLKIILPLIALGLLSTLFLLSRSVDPTSTIPFSESELRDRLTSTRVTAPQFVGNTPAGDAIMVTAQSVTADPDQANRATADGLRVRYDLVGGSQISLTANRGLVDQDGDYADLSGDILITSSEGYTLVTDFLEMALSRIEARSRGPVSGTGPAGTLNAGQLIVTSNEDGDVQLLFTQGVTLVYDRQSRPE